jgi:hypothetical protein
MKRRRVVIAGTVAAALSAGAGGGALWNRQAAQYCEPELRSFSESDVGTLTYHEDEASLWSCLERVGLVRHGVPRVLRDDDGRPMSEGGKTLIFK